MKLFRYLFAVFLAWLALMLVLPGLVFAGATDPAGPVVQTDTLASVRLSATVVMAIVSVFLPLLVGLVTTIKTHPLTKGLLEIVLAAVAAMIVQWKLADGTAIISEQTFVVWLIGLAASLVAYYKAWKPARITSSAVLVPGANNTVIAQPGKLASVGIK